MNKKYDIYHFSCWYGNKLHQLTLKHPKSLYKLDNNTTVLQRMILGIQKFDEHAEIVVVVGFQFQTGINEIKDLNVATIINPFYAVTNSIASLWFARKYLKRDNVVVIDGDIVLSDKLMKEIVCVPTDKPCVLGDSSCPDEGDYNVRFNCDKVCVMSKNLSKFDAEYVCLTKLDKISARLLSESVCDMVLDDMYDQYFENALVQMIFEKDFELYYKDIKGEEWTEVDCVDDLLKAKKINRD